MTFLAMGSLVREDLETRAKNLLEKVIYVQNGESKTFCVEENVNKEIEFLIKNEYLLQKEKSPSPEYEITSKGKEYVLR